MKKLKPVGMLMSLVIAVPPLSIGLYFVDSMSSQGRLAPLPVDRSVRRHNRWRVNRGAKG